MNFRSCIGFVLLFILVFCEGSLSGTETKLLKISFSGKAPGKLYLHSFYGVKTARIDSAEMNMAGNFLFSISTKIKLGYYRILANDTNYTDVILTGLENVDVEVKGTSLKKDVEIKRSEENKALWRLKEMRIGYNDEKYKLMGWYRKTNEPEKKKRIKASLDSLEKDFNQKAYTLLNKNKKTYFSLTNRMILSPLFTDSLILRRDFGNDTAAFMKKNFFNNIDFSKAEIVNSTLLPNQYMKFFEKHVEFDEKGFTTAIDMILGKAKANPLVYQLSLDFLLQLFDEAGPSVVFEYIVNKYYDSNTCNSGYAENALRLRALNAGNIIPDMNLDTLRKSLKDIYSGNELTLLYFWSSHCGFCAESLGMMKEVYTSYNGKGLEILAVSLDENGREWSEYISKNALVWINYNEFKGWESPLVRRLMVNKTPTYYLIDRNGVIVAKNFNFVEVRELIKTLLDKK